MTDNKNNKINYLSFSLWGDKPLYNIGAIRNAQLAKAIYKNWQMIVYIDQTVPSQTVKQLQDHGVLVKDMTGSGIYGPFWRFLAADLEDGAYVVFRDADSRISVREKLAVDEWIENGDAIHIMRDHPFHEIPAGTEERGILSGMWGIKCNISKLEPLIRTFLTDKDDYYGIDQSFLQEIYKKYSHSQTVHDEFFEGKPFPAKRRAYRFVGERIDEHEQPLGDDWKHIQQYYKTRRPSLMTRLKKFFK